MGLSKDTVTYYDRCMDQVFIDKICTDYPWLIDYVKSKAELDFQTGHDPRSGKSWFSIYRGTGRVLTFESNSRTIKAADAYRNLMPSSFITKPNAKDFDKYLKSISESTNLDQYYESSDSKKEGFYQNLIARRYTFLNNENDDFIIIDKEFVLGFYSEVVKNEWCSGIVDEQEQQISQLKKVLPTYPKDIKAQYGEFDFLALTWEGDIVIMELKQDDPQKTYLSPVQVGYYYKQFSKLIKEDDGTLYQNIIKMVNQKVQLGLIKIPNGLTLPLQLSKKIKTCVIVGEDNLSDEIRKRYKLTRDIFLPDMQAYTCNLDGTMIPSKLEL